MAPETTGVNGLDEVLNGGLTPRRLYLLEGDPGSGKTTLALQFLLEGVRQGQRCMFVTLSETTDELWATAESHGWSLEGIDILEIIASEETLKTDARYTMYHPSEVELGETTKNVLTEVDRVNPSRLIVDSLSEFRLLADNPLRYRRHILALKQHFARLGCTVVFVDDRSGGSLDKHLHSIAHGVIRLDRQTSDYGVIRRRLEVSKLRGQQFREGYHDFRIRQGGIEVFPRLVAAEHTASVSRESIGTGLASLDSLLGGGLARGTSTLILGAAGTGKSSLGTQIVQAAVDRGEHAAIFLFDESISTFLERSVGLGFDFRSHVESNQVLLRQIDPAELSPGEFTHLLRHTVESNRTKLLVVDSLNGYLNAMPSENFLMLHLHELLSYLGRQEVTTLLMVTQHGIIGNVEMALDVSYVSDTVILLRYFEAFGEVHKAISVIKKRTGKHEQSVREMKIAYGVQVGEPLRDFRGVLSGLPEFIGKPISAAGQTSGAREDA